MLQELIKNPYILEVHELKFADGLQDCQYFKIIYLSQGHRVVGYILVPTGIYPLPCIIYNRSGSGSLNVIDERKLSEHKYTKFTAWGYITIMTQYSGNGGSDGVDEFGGSEIEDVLVLKNILENCAFTDTSRIGMYGSSRGGSMTYLALSKVDWIRAAVIKAGMADKFRSITLRPEMKIRSDQFFDTNNEKEMIKRSAIRWANKIDKNTHILLIHGTADTAVPVLDSIEMSKLMKKECVHCRLLLLENGDHGLTDFETEVEAETRKWFDEFVKN